MTVGELKKMLESKDDALEVIMSKDAGWGNDGEVIIEAQPPRRYIRESYVTLAERLAP